MPRTLQNPDSWFHTARVRAGFETRLPLAQRLGVSLDTVKLWDLGKHRPPWQLIGVIANALKVPGPEVVEALWNEKVGDPCPCGCGGKKVLPGEALEGPEGAVFVEGDPGQLRRARMLPIKLPCTECGKIRIYQHRRKRSHHRALCPACTRLEDTTPFKCDGYRLPNFDTPQYAEHCPRTIFLAPWQIHKRQRWTKTHPDNFFDVSSQRYQCGRCRKAAIPVGNRVKRLRELEAKESGQRRLSMVTITTRKQLNTLFRKHRDNQDLYRREDGPEILARGLYPLLNRVPEWAQEKGRQTYVDACKTGKKWPEMTKGCMLRRWGRRCDQPICFHDPHPGVKCSHCSCLKYRATEFPRDVRFGLCVLCWNKGGHALIIRRDSANIKLRFHAPCYHESMRKGGEAGKQSYKAGRRPTEEDLKLRWSWLWQHFAGGRSYGEIAREHELSRSTVEERVEFMIHNLPESYLVDDRYGPIIKLAKVLIRTPK